MGDNLVKTQPYCHCGSDLLKPSHPGDMQLSQQRLSEACNDLRHAMGVPCLITLPGVSMSLPHSNPELSRELLVLHHT